MEQNNTLAAFPDKNNLSLYCALCVILLCGCVSTLNRLKPYSDYLGKELTLQENAVLVKGEAWTGGNLEMIFFPPHETYLLYRVDNPILLQDYFKSQESWAVPKGTPLRLTKVVDRLMGSGAVIEAQGEIYIASLDKYVPFLYSWGYQCEKYLKRAPWEDPHIPEKTRPLHYRGCS